jgi:tRNA uridine 5-carboxymethylaminomethyl modification enzyme
MIAGDQRAAGGRAGDRADRALAASLHDFGFRLRRLKTGTPPRVDARSVDFSAGERQPGDEMPAWFSWEGGLGRIAPLTLPPLPLLCEQLGQTGSWRPQLACVRLGTNERTHALIRANLHRAPMFNGSVEGIGPRYCPSIEDKVARFGDKPTHPIFLEPEGWRTHELYVQGMSTSLPPEIQEAALRTVPGLAAARITRYGYAVEYDAVDPIELSPSLEAKRLHGLFLAGQVNGTSGYEEAAGQGLIAGLNAANAVRARPAVILRRDQAYIGVMIDDLVTKPFDEPYRMLTSRAEHRLLLRPDSAARRLAGLAYEEGLIEDDRYREVDRAGQAANASLAALARAWLTPNERCAEALTAAELAPVGRPMTALDVLRRPETTIGRLAVALSRLGDETLLNLDERIMATIETEAKYGAFIARADREAARQAGLEEQTLPVDLDFEAIPELRIEAREKLSQYRPATIGQAGRVPGVTPADLAVLMVRTARRRTRPEREAVTG